jgi:hypothetical protein
MRTFLRDATVHRKSAEKGKQDKDECRKGRDRSGSQECNAGLISQGRKVSDTREAHHLRLRMRVF